MARRQLTDRLTPVTDKAFTRQYSAILAEMDATWQTTREIADRTPWSVLTMMTRLRVLESNARVECETGTQGRPRRWRLR